MLAVLKKVVMVFSILALSMQLLPIEPAEAIRTNKTFRVGLYLAGADIWWHIQTGGWDSSSDPTKIIVNYAYAGGEVINGDWLKSQGVTMAILVDRGRIYDGNTIKFTYDWTDLNSGGNGISAPYPWGGYMYIDPTLWLAKSTPNKHEVRISYTHNLTPLVYYATREHVFYDNGWRDVISQ